IGPGADWRPSLNIPFNYCELSLEPIGQVARGEVKSTRGLSKAFSITEYGRQVGIPAVGLLLNWGLNYPDISAQDVFGSTQSRGEVRAPHNRITVLYELATHPSKSLSNVDIAGVNPKDWQQKEYQDKVRMVDDTTRALAAKGLITTERISEENTRMFRITDGCTVEDKPRHSIYRLALNRFIRQRQVNSNLEFTSEECIQEVIADLTSRNPQLDIANIRQRINTMLGSTAHNKDGTIYPRILPNLERLGMFNGGRHTRITLNPDYKQAIEDLLDIVVAIEDMDESKLMSGKECADAIAADSDLKRQLINKAYEFSPAAQKRPVAETMNEIYKILKNADGVLDTGTILSLYKDNHERPIGKGAVERMLRNMADKGIVIIHKNAPEASRLKLRNYYELAPNNNLEI
ncbi:MAG: hypothetical protein ACXWLH_05975, partial [Candidatus Saccharimonadales bacterium]